MNLRVESVFDNRKEIKKVTELYEGSFPQNERIPMKLLLWKAKQDFVDFLVIYDNDVFVGFTYLITREDLTYVLYIAIDNKIRSKGYGSLALAQIKEKYPDNRIILNIEVIDETASNYEQRVTRRKFYTRNGYEGSSYSYRDRWGLYEVMIHGGKVNAEEFHALLKRFAGALLFSVFKPQITPSTEL
ncbi:GNAT family N-acetyltransferase [Planococcus shixiaomingii]|uniref:GNAT family N-acetyltransferase n=1 Tax=Planococcus shixiaomingii TaxID=3058393 RepID=UPI002623BF25|nr:GNAT family N-acetyltransferase [Planococcus sp. N022]WKA54539.1 GNAT family N-acetyltransferase [Planococcus sp. N022]